MAVVPTKRRLRSGCDRPSLVTGSQLSAEGGGGGSWPLIPDQLWHTFEAVLIRNMTGLPGKNCLWISYQFMSCIPTSSHYFGRMTCQQWALLKMSLLFMGLTIAEPWRNIGSSPHQEKKLANKHLIGSTRFSNKNTPFQKPLRLMIILLRQLQRTNCLQTGSSTYLTWR